MLLAAHFSNLVCHCPHSLHPGHPGLLTVTQTHQTCSSFRTSDWLILLPGMFLPQISTQFSSLPPLTFASNISYSLKPSSNTLFKIACHRLTFPLLLYFSPLDLLSNMPYSLPELAIVHLFSLGRKLHEGRNFYPFCSLIYTLVFRSKPGT